VSGDEVDASVGVEQGDGAGPAVEDPHDLGSGSADDPGRGVPDRPAQRFGFGAGERPGQAELLEPADQGVGHADGGEPGGVGLEVAEGESVGGGVLQSADVIFDMGVGAHVTVKFDRFAGGVGLVTPVAAALGAEQALLGSGVQRFASDDQSGSRRPVRQVDQIGDLDHGCTVADLAVLADGGRPCSRPTDEPASPGP
jgi:hypothetical protein